MSKKIKVLLLSLMLCTLQSALSAPNPTIDKPVVEIEKVAITNIRQTVRLIGIIKAKRSAVLVARTSGALDYAVSPGQRVDKGTLIAKLENTELEKSFELSQSTAVLAKASYDRVNSSNAISKQDIEERRRGWLEAQKNLAESKIALDKSRYIAPFSGVVGAFKVREGTELEVGNQIVTIYDPSELIIEFDIPAPLLSKLANRTQVWVNNKPYTVDQIQKMIDPDTHMSPAYIDYPCENCVVGENIDIDLTIAEHEKQIVIPHEAIFLRDGVQNVYLVKENKIALTPVTLGIREKDKVEILTGLSPGDQLVVRGKDHLYPEQEVILSAKPKQG